MALTAPIRSNCASVSASSSSDLLPSSISLLWRGSQTVTEATSGLINLYNQAECVPSSKTTSTLPLNPRKKSQIFSALVLTFEWLSIWPSAFKTTITVIVLWTSMPTYLTLFIRRLLVVRNLGHCLFKITISGASFHITSSRSAREAWRVSPDISPRSFPSHLTRVGAVPIEFEAHPTEGSRGRCGGSTPESLCRSADGRSAFSTSSANRDGSLPDAI